MIPIPLVQKELLNFWCPMAKNLKATRYNTLPSFVIALADNTFFGSFKAKRNILTNLFMVKYLSFGWVVNILE